MKEEPNYCIDTAAGAAHCAKVIVPSLAADMSSAGFSWTKAIHAIIAFVSVML